MMGFPVYVSFMLHMIQLYHRMSFEKFLPFFLYGSTLCFILFFKNLSYMFFIYFVQYISSIQVSPISLFALSFSSHFFSESVFVFGSKGIWENTVYSAKYWYQFEIRWWQLKSSLLLVSLPISLSNYLVIQNKFIYKEGYHVLYIHDSFLFSPLFLFFHLFFLLMFHSYDLIIFYCSIDFGVALLMGYGEIAKYLFDFILYYFAGWKLRVWLNVRIYFEIFFGYAEKISTHLFF